MQSDPAIVLWGSTFHRTNSIWPLWTDNDPATSSRHHLADGSFARCNDFALSELGTNGPEFLPVWSPDGRELLFSRGDERRMRLLRQALNGGTVQTVLDSDGPKFPSDWSSDGRFVAFSTQWPDYQDIHVWTGTKYVL
jgi:Tol biopolymer transport system component